MSKGTCWDTWKREGGCPGRKGRGKNVLVTGHLASTPKTRNFGEISGGKRQMACGPTTPRHGGNPAPAAQEILHGWSKELHRTDSCSDPDWALGISHLLQEDTEAAER
jgi:hypothetical protein